jgi:hypothetical protein
VLGLAKAQGVELPVEKKKQVTSGSEQDEKRTCQVCKAIKGGSGIKTSKQMATGYVDPADHSKGRWCIRCQSAATDKRKADAKKAAAVAEPEAAAPNLAATAAPPDRGP